MKKDIPNYKVKDLAIAIVPRERDTEDEDLWDVYVINLKPKAIHSVLVSSKGYGNIRGEYMETTVLRHFFDEVEAESFLKIEPIQTKLFALANEYWISFSYEDYMYDKKYVFVKGSISPDNFTTIPYLNRRGVMIR